MELGDEEVLTVPEGSVTVPSAETLADEIYVKALQGLAVKCNEPFHELIRGTVLASVIEELRKSEAWGQEECGYCKPPVTRAIGAPGLQ